MASKGPQRSKQGTAGKRKHITLMLPQKLQIIRRLKSGKRQQEILASYKMEGLQSFTESSESVKDLTSYILVGKYVSIFLGK
jgi:hypothetical protein